jgi:hypothetical protein
LRQLVHARKSYRNISPDILRDISQKEDIWYDSEIQMYRDLITTLKNIKLIFTKNPSALQDYIYDNTQVIKGLAYYHLDGLKKSLRVLFQKKVHMILS